MSDKNFKIDAVGTVPEVKENGEIALKDKDAVAITKENGEVTVERVPVKQKEEQEQVKE